ncbi:MAG: right-handed parallel beta-helix repeat-containing protein [Thermodesulfobacteriota bacterium]|nr:right-handed parallel beta-helix repeat-containing protein [Thermodesulfobacteriota bacterium]
MPWFYGQSHLFLMPLRPPRELPIDFPPKTNEYYVNLDASLNGNGTLSSPWNNIEAADGNVGIPAWIYVKGTGPGTIWSQDGSSGSEIVITAWQDETATFTDIEGGPSLRIWGDYVILHGKSFVSPQIVIKGAEGQRAVRIGYDHGAGGGHHATFYRCEITQGSSAIMNDGEYLRVINCRIHDTTSHAIYFRHGDHCEFRNNIFQNADGAAIQSNPHENGEYITAGVISGNVVYDCARETAAGLTVLSGTGTGGIINGLTISNNLIWNCSSGIKMTGGNNYKGEISNVQIYNNTIYNCSVFNQHGEPFTPGKPATTILINNIVTGGITNEGTWVAENNNVTDNSDWPSFFISVDENNDAFLKLASLSTDAIDKGYDLSSEGIAADYFGNSRPLGGGYDIGAHEYSPETVNGDVNNDGSVDSEDVDACVSHILGTENWNEAADVNGDGSMNVLDVQAVVNMSLSQ